MIGRIHSLETFGTVDGPGIRFVLFLQGCHWRCLYCHNPDTWDVGAGTQMDTATLLETILRYKPWFEASGGGLTVSGGEPMLQMDFVTTLFQICKTEGIHTCLDTNGDMSGDETSDKRIGALLASTDLVLLDLKHADPKVHQTLTGASQKEPLRFLALLEKANIPTILRHVVVPGLTDAPEQLALIRQWKDTYSNIQEIQWLPYHRLGVHKWEALGFTYPLGDTPAASDSLMTAIREGTR